MSTLSVINLQSQSTTAPVVFQTSTGTEIGQLCRAWVNFNGTTSPGTIRASFNVSSITKNATGDYTVNFTNSLADANYSPIVSMQAPAATNGYVYINNFLSGGSVATSNQTASAYRVWFNNADSAQVATAVFR